MMKKKYSISILFCLTLLTSALQGADMRIFVKTPTRKKIALDVNSSDKIKSVKQQIQNKEGFLAEKQKLFDWDERQELDNDATLSDYSIYGDAELSLTLDLSKNESLTFFNPKNWPGLVQFGVATTIILGIIGTTLYIFMPKSKKEREKANKPEEENQNSKDTSTQKKSR